MVPVVGFQVNMETTGGADMTLFSLVVRRSNSSLWWCEDHTLLSHGADITLLSLVERRSHYCLWWCSTLSPPCLVVQAFDFRVSMRVRSVVWTTLSTSTWPAWLFLQNTLCGASVWSFQAFINLVECLWIALLILRSRTLCLKYEVQWWWRTGWRNY